MALLIGNLSNANTFPIISVQNSTTRIEHEASTSKIGEEQIFYFLQRGICLEKAVELGITEPAEILNHTRKTIIDRLKKDGSVDGGKDGMDCSLISIDTSKIKLTYSAANNAIWIIRDNKIIELTANKMPVGKHDHD